MIMAEYSHCDTGFRLQLWICCGCNHSSLGNSELCDAGLWTRDALVYNLLRQKQIWQEDLELFLITI